MSEWISVKDSLPVTAGNYICFSNKNKIYLLKFSAHLLDSRMRWWSPGGTETTSITHWMPLPPLPESEA